MGMLIEQDRATLPVPNSARPASQVTTSYGSPAQDNTPPQQKQPTNWTPSPKLATAVGAGTPLAIIVSYIAQGLGLQMPDDVALAIAGLIIGVVGYFTPAR